MDTRIHNCLTPYRDLVARVDRLIGDVRCKYPADVACHKGCNCGCRNLSIFPVEALSVLMAIQELPAKAADAIRQRAQLLSIWECPLLKHGACGLYAYRPIICRTHGFPLQTIYNGRPSIGYCRHNFKNWSVIPHDAITDLDRINCSLRAINAAVVRQLAFQMPDRLSIAAAVELHRFVK
jgi:Fe-S-cluster containining protein